MGVLGPTRVQGASRPFGRAWSLELVVYLALHPDGASSDVWATALWPDRVMAPATLHSTASSARRSLGSARSGRDHLPWSHGRLRLEPTVSTDWRRFCALASCPEPGDWAEALALVRGRPVEGLRSSDWAVFEGVSAEIEEAIVAVGLRLATLCLESGDGAGAARAARQALRASPYDERLYRCLLRAADAQGNPAAVETTMAHLGLMLAGDDGLPIQELVHPETASLYESLSRRGAGRRLVTL